MTAVEWLTEKVNSKEWQDMYLWHKEEVFKQAKAMEKHQQDKFTNAPIHDKKAIIEMMNKLHPKEMAEVVEFIKIKIETYGKQ